MVIPLCPKTPADPILGTHNGACGYACLHGIARHTTISIIWYTKNVWPCKMRRWIENELIELINSDQFRLSIPIQFQFKIFQFNSNSIHAELNWIDYQFQFNSWIDPSPDITFAAWKEIFASSFMPSEFKPLSHCIPVLQIVTERGRVFIMLLYPPLNGVEGGYTGFTLSVPPSISALFSMLFSALWLGCGELGMRKYSPRYLRVMAEMRRFLRIPVRILPSAFSPHFLRIFSI